MTRYTYPAVVTHYPEEGWTYTATFPDFPDLTVADDNLVDTLTGMNNMLEVYIEDLISTGHRLPEPTPFEPVTNMAEGQTSWWTIATCEVDSKRWAKSYGHDYVYDEEPPPENTSENFERIMRGLKEVHDMVSADSAKSPKSMRPISDENFRKVMEGVAEDKLFWDMVSVSKIATTPLTVESMNEVLGRYRAAIGWDDMSDEDRVAFHGNRPMTAGFMNPDSANRPKGDEQ